MVEVDRRSWVTILRLVEAELWRDDVVNALGRELAAQIESAGRRPVILSFGPLQCFGSSLVARILWLYRQLRVQGRRLILCDLPASFGAVLERMRLTTLLTIYPDEREALCALDA
jgi:anti-anti-sigma regulatory factor